MGIYALNFALNYEIVIDTRGLPQPGNTKISLKSSTDNIRLKDSSKEIQFPA